MSAYRKSAKYYDLIYHFKNYSEDSARLKAIIAEHHPAARTLLEVACGTGLYLEQLVGDYALEGLDINEELLTRARDRLPGIPLHLGNMMDFDLGRSFDVVTCLFSSIVYVQTAANMKRTVANLARHVTPGGLLLIEPMFPPENYWLGRVTLNTYDGPDLKIVWMYVSERAGDMARLNYHFMVGTPQGIETFEEVHDLGLFTDAEYRDAFADAGLEVAYHPVGTMNRGMYIGRRKE